MADPALKQPRISPFCKNEKEADLLIVYPEIQHENKDEIAKYSRNPTKLIAIEAIECPKCTCSNPGFALLVDLFFAISQALHDVLQATWRAP